MIATNGAAKAAGGHQQAEEIPAFQSIAPCIFIPAQTDLTKPPSDLPSEPNALLSETLAQINEHADAVQDNIYYMLTARRRESGRNVGREKLTFHIISKSHRA